MTMQEHLMHAVMDEVEKAIQEKNSPFGAVIAALDGTIIATAHATTHSEMDPTAHGEMNAIRSACKKLGTKDLSPYCLVSNAQSCPM
ncbi:MAG: nucleoside deaminase, partial [Patescibacteria group bacterium]